MADQGSRIGAERIEIAVSRLSELRPLRAWLERVPAVEVEQGPRPPAPGEQGAADLLTLLAGSGGALAVAVRSLPAFLRARRSDVTLTLKTGDKEFSLEAKNVEDIAPLIEKLLAEGDEDVS